MLFLFNPVCVASFRSWLPCLCGMAFLGFSCHPAVKNDKPNIVLIVADDLGWKDVGFMGSGYYETPNLDALSERSTWFTQAYAGASNCAPSRACLLTGLNTPRHGIYTVSPSERGDRRARRLIPASNTMVLHDSFTTIAEVLHQSGYQTCSIGKWHIGAVPRSQGFDINIGGTSAGHPKSYYSPYANAALSDGPPGEYLTDRLTDEAIRFIRSDKQKPFFLYLPYFAIHTPLQGPEDLVEHYRDKPPSDGQGSNADYAAMVTRLDWNIGRILRILESLDPGSNTLVIVTSDNGGISYLSRQWPLRAGKGSYYEGGVRVPLIFYWPGKIPAGMVVNTPVSQLDLFSTILDLAGIAPIPRTDGLSLGKLLLEDKPLSDRALYWHFPVYLEAYKVGDDESRDPLFRTRPGTTMRYHNWKLHYFMEDQQYELYDLSADPGEKINLDSRQLPVEDTLRSMMTSWWQETGAPIPATPNPDFDPSFEIH